jgi:hypothetical protein
VRGLRHVIARSVAFDAHVGATIKEAIDRRVPVRNFYRFVPSSPVGADEIAKRVEEDLHRPASAYDSHPPPHARIERVEAIAAPGRALNASESELPVWALFTQQERLELDMSHQIRDILLDKGIALPVRAAEPAEGASAAP